MFLFFLFFLVMESLEKGRWVDQETGTAGHASTWTSKGGTPANAAASRDPATMEVLAGEALRSGLPVPTSGPVTGTAQLATAELITSPAALAASSAAGWRMSPPEAAAAATTLICPVREVSGSALAAAVAEAAAPDGNPETGFATGEWLSNLIYHIVN